MGLIKFFIEKYNLKEFFSFEIKLFYGVRSLHSYLLLKYGKISKYIGLMLELFLFLLIFSKFSSYFILFFVFTIIKNYLILNYKFISGVKYKNILVNLWPIILQFKGDFLIFFFKFVKKFYIFKFLYPPFVYFFTFLKLYCWKRYYSLKFFKNVWFFLFKEEIFLKIFFNFKNPINVARFFFLINNLFYYYFLNPVKRIHYVLMSIPMENHNGAVQVRWLAYAGPVKFYFFLVRWFYYADLDKKFAARHYYREKMFVSYVKNFVYLYLFFFSKTLFLLKSLSGGLFLYIVKLKNFFFFNIFNLNKKGWSYMFFVFVSIIKNLFFVMTFFILFYLFCSIFKLYFFNILYIFVKFLDKLFHIYDSICLFFYGLKLFIKDRLLIAFITTRFGWGWKSRKRFHLYNFSFIVSFWYWLKRDYSGRFQFFYKFKKFPIRKRRAAFRLVFKFFFIFKYSYFFLNFIFIFIEYIFFYPLFWLFLKIVWACFADLCFVF